MRLPATLPAHLQWTVHRVGRALVDGVLPPRCLACSATVDDPDALCAICWNTMSFFAAPWCAVCGLPFAHPMGEGAVCGACAGRPPHWDRARSVMRYDKHSRALSLKHGDRTHLARLLG
jgi:predicted amidophosphoribosyltransferase